ncbi:hypothetical protein RB595_000150 [Gaeumannomyces hyphopodioides]
MLSARLTLPATLVLLAAGLQAILVDAEPSPLTPRDDPASIGAIGDITWEGELEPGKGNVTLTGQTFEQIEQQAKQMNETYSIFKSSQAGAAKPSEAAPAGVRSTDCQRGKLPPARSAWILASAASLRRLEGTCYLSGRLCSRAACQWDSAIYWCNDNVGRLGAPCTAIAERAEHLFEHCSNGPIWMQGSVTDDWNWRAIVRGDKC